MKTLGTRSPDFRSARRLCQGIFLTFGMVLSVQVGFSQTMMAHFGLENNLTVDNDHAVGVPTAANSGLTYSTSYECEESYHLIGNANSDYLDVLINTTGYQTISISWQQRLYGTGGSGTNVWNFYGDYNDDGTFDFSVTDNPAPTTSCYTVTLSLPSTFNNQTDVRLRIQRAGSGYRTLGLDDISITGTVQAGFCYGYALAVYDQYGVNNPQYALDASNSSGAELYQLYDRLDLDLTGGMLLTAGTTVNVTWRRAYGSSPTVNVQFSDDGTAWSTPPITFTVNNDSYSTQSIILSQDARYIRFTTINNSNDLNIDAVAYDCCESPTLFTVTGGGTYCSGGTGLPVGLDGSQSGVSYQLYLNANPVGSSLAGTGSAISFGIQTAAGTYTVKSTNANDYCVRSMNGQAVITIINAVPSQPSAIAGPASPCQGTASISYSVTNVSGTTYTWTVPTGWTITAGQGTSTITVTVGTTGGTISVTPSNACGNGTARTLAVTVTMAVPAQPSPITGPSAPCQGISNSYSVTNVSGVSYTWAVPGGWTLTAGQGTSSITVTVGSSSGNITVTPSNSCGNGSSQTLSVSSTAIPAQPSEITENSTPCQGATGISYSVTNVSGVTYSWTVPSGWTITDGQGLSVITVTVGSTNGNITVTPSNACGSGTARSLAVTAMTVPAQPSAINGPASPCQGATGIIYSVTDISGVGYTWTVPSSWTITGGQGTNSMTVTVGSASGNITVTPSNACGSGTSRTISVTVMTVPVQPSEITGLVTPCSSSSQVYSVINVSGVSYIWSFPTGWTQTAGGNTNSVTVTVGSNPGSITVTPTNVCGNGTARDLGINPLSIPAQPAEIAGDNTPCQGFTQNYSVTNVAGVTYTWTVPSGWTITSGQGTNQLTVTAGSSSGILTVVPSNVCGSGAARTLSLTVLQVPAQTGPIQPVVNVVCQGSTQNYMVTPAPPAGVTYAWAGPAGSTVLSGQGTNIISIKFGNTSGNLTITPSNECGNGPVQTMAITVLNSAPGQPSAITGKVAPCVGSSEIYSVTNVAGLIYTWTLPAGWTITAGQGTNSLTVTAGSAAGTISVVPVNPCGSGQPRTLSVTPQPTVPSQPGSITGNTPVCVGSTQTYSIVSGQFVTNTWTYPAGWTLLSGQGTATVMLTAGASSGIISVTPSNSCGSGPAQSKNIVVDLAVPSATSAISGDASPCEASTQTYSVTQVNGVTYTWSIPGTWTVVSGQGTNSIQVSIGTVSGNIQVIPSNGCGNGPVTSLTATIDPLPPPAGTITGGTWVCEASVQTYQVTDLGATYNWTVPSGWIITSGQGTHLITVTVGSTTGNIQVIPHNYCGDGVAGSLAVTANLLPAAYTGPDGAICAGDDIQIGGSPVGSNSYSWVSDPPGFTSNVSNPVVEPTVPTIYTLTETTSAGCVKIDNVTIVANQIIEVYIAPPAQAICTGETTNISITSNILEAIVTWTVTGPAHITGQSNGGGPLISQTLVNTSDIPGQVTYWLTLTADECENKEESVVVTVNPDPVASNASATLCSHVPIGMTLPASNNAVAIASYNIVSINNNGLIASAGNPATGTGFSNAVITDDAWANTGTNAVNVIYTIAPVSGSGCIGPLFTVTATIDPEPVMTTAPAKNICSGVNTGINLTSTIPSNYSWTIGTITGAITGASAGAGTSINQVLTNPGNANPGTVEYIVTPVSVSAGCTGAPLTITVTVNPVPQTTTNPAFRICSGQATNIPLTATAPSNFSWSVGTITGSITGASGGSGSSIGQVLTNPSNATAGTVQYLVTATSISGSCSNSPYSVVVTVDPIPTVTAGANDMDVCPGTSFNLLSNSSLIYYPTPILSQGFNASTNNWTTYHNSSGGTIANGLWTLRPDGYQHNSITFHSNDNTQFYLSSSYAQGSGSTTNTYLQSPAISTVGYASLSLDFYHYYRQYENSRARVQVSTNGTNWTTIMTYSTNQGTSGNFLHPAIDLSSYVGLPTFYIRFYYYGQYDRYWAIDNVTIWGTISAPIPIISWSSDPPGFTSTEQNPPNISQTKTTTYTVTYTNPISLCNASNSVTVVTLPLPAASITADYCAQPGCVELTAHGGGTYNWSTDPPLTDQVVCIDEAGIYSTVVTGTNGCVTTAYLTVANEFVTNGSFSDGNTGFSSDYGYREDLPDFQYELWPEGLYSVGYDPYTYHINFYGADRTNPGNGQFMIVNGWGSELVVWEETVPVVPDFNYYFSAWAMSTNDEGAYARLRFEVNGEQVGTIAELGTGPADNSQVDPTDWIRFYSNPKWNSGSATSAVIRIINLRPDLFGNDFGLDDISFGTLDPIPFIFAPSGSEPAVCELGPFQLFANISGGMLPYFFSWTGPNGFSSTEQDPIIPNMALASQGEYTLTVYDSYGCDPRSGSVWVDVYPAPTADINGGGDFCQFEAAPFIVFRGTSGPPPYSFKYNLDGGPTQTISTTGADSTAFIFASTAIAGTFTYNLINVEDAHGCERPLTTSTTLFIHELPVCYIDGDTTVCPNDIYLSYSGPPLMDKYEWSITGNGIISGNTDEMIVTVESGGECGTDFTLSLVTSNEYDCNSMRQLIIPIVDDQPPVITTTAMSQDLGCNPSLVEPVFTGTDNCEGIITPIITSDGPVIDGCAYLQTWDANYTDACNNSATEVSITYTWIQDPESPSASNPPDFVLHDCISSFPVPDIEVITDESDNCGIHSVTWVSDEILVKNDCGETIVRSYSLTDLCGNSKLVTQNLIRVLDNGTWVGASDDWNTSTNWCGGVPDETIDVTIGPCSPINPVVYLGNGGICRSLTINEGRSLTINGTFDAHTLINDGSITIHSIPGMFGSMRIADLPGTGTGMVTYNLFMKGDDHHMFAAPVTELISTFEELSHSDIREWDEPEGMWEISGDESFFSGKGYAWYTTNTNNETRPFQGSLTMMPLIRSTTAPYSEPHEGHETGRPWGGGGWNLLGNPFTCALNISGTGTNFIETNFNYFDPQYVGVYLYEGGWSWPVIGLPTGDFHTGTTYHQAVQVGQGFLVLTYGDGINFNFTTDMQIHATEVPLTKPVQAGEEWFGLHLNVNYGNLKNFTTIVYNQAMTAGLDPGYDVGQFSGGPPVEIYTKLVTGSDVNFARQALPLADYENNVVSVGIDSENGGEVTFSAWIIPIEGHTFFLEDKLTNIFTDLGKETYTVTLPAFTYGTGRFYIHAVPAAAVGTEETEPDNQPDIKVWTSGDRLTIEGELSSQATATLYDLLGRHIMEIRLTGDKSTTFSVPSYARGIYLLQVIDGKKTCTHKLTF